jgi:hypothetical protein
MTRPDAIRPLNTPPPEATITGPYRGIFRYHAGYVDGIFHIEGGSLAFTRKGIERKANRVLRRLRRDRERREQATVLR